MKKIALLALLFVMMVSSSMAQRLIHNQKAPDIIIKSAVVGERIPKGKPIYIDFFSINSSDNERQLLNLSNLARSYGEHIYFTIITNNGEAEIKEYFSEYAKKNDVNFSVLVDDAGQTFSNYNIKFVPNAVLVDKKGRFVWQGKSSNIDEYTIRQVLP